MLYDLDNVILILGEAYFVPVNGQARGGVASCSECNFLHYVTPLRV